MYGCSKHFRKKGIAYVNNNTLSCPSLLSIDQNDTQKEEPILLYMEFATAIGSLIINVSSCCHEHKITHALLPQKCEIRQKKINMTKHGDSPLSIAV